MQSKTILIVEDDVALGTLLLEFLQEEIGRQVFLAPNGESAIHLFQQIAPDVCILDYHLPDTNGLDLSRHLQQLNEHQSIPMVLMSANLPSTIRAMPYLGLLKKPFDLDILLELVMERLLPPFTFLSQEKT